MELPSDSLSDSTEFKKLSMQLDELNGTLKQLQQSHDHLQQTIITQGKILKKIHDRSLKEKIKTLFRPKLGILEQYPPKEMKIPRHYQSCVAPNSAPTISIVTPSFNQGPFLEKTLMSVLAQNYPHLEFIIQDGGSIDNSISIIERFQHQLAHWESKKDNGQSHALNLGFQHATGEIMAYLNSDDLLLSGALHYVANYFLNHPEVDVVYGHRIVINQSDFEIGRWILPKHDDKALTWADFIPQETLFWRRRIWNKIGGRMDESFKFAMDWDLLLRFREADAKFVRLPRFLGAFRIHPSQKTTSSMNSTGLSEMHRLKQRCHGRHVNDEEVNYHLRFYIIQHIILQKLYRAGIIRY